MEDGDFLLDFLSWDTSCAADGGKRVFNGGFKAVLEDLAGKWR